MLILESQLSSQDQNQPGPSGITTRARTYPTESQASNQSDGDLFTSNFSDRGCPLVLQNIDGSTRENSPKALRLPFRPSSEELCAVCNGYGGDDAEVLSIDLESRLFLNGYFFELGDKMSLFWDRQENPTGEQIVCSECLQETNAKRQTLKSACFTYRFHVEKGNLKNGATNLSDVFNDSTTPFLLNAATKALQNEFSNLRSSYRKKIADISQHLKKSEFIFPDRYLQ